MSIPTVDFVVADIETAVLRTLQKTDLNVSCCRLMSVEYFQLNKMLKWIFLSVLKLRLCIHRRFKREKA